MSNKIEEELKELYEALSTQERLQYRFYERILQEDISAKKYNALLKLMAKSDEKSISLKLQIRKLNLN